MPEKEKNKAVLITGASRGIGRELAYEFAKSGFNLALTYYQDEAAGKMVSQKCRELGAREVLLLRLDITDDENLRNVAKEIASFYGKINFLINNAAILISKPLREQSFEEINEQIKTNLEGLIKLTKECLPLVSEAIINIGSNLSFLGKKSLTVYSATKFALRGFTQALAKELPDLKIYAVHPGLTATGMGNDQGITPERVAKIIFHAAMGHYRLTSGSDIRVRYYLHGLIRRNVLMAWDLFKSIWNR